MGGRRVHGARTRARTYTQQDTTRTPLYCSGCTPRTTNIAQPQRAPRAQGGLSKIASSCLQKSLDRSQLLCVQRRHLLASGGAVCGHDAKSSWRVAPLSRVGFDSYYLQTSVLHHTVKKLFCSGVLFSLLLVSRQPIV